MVKHFIKVRCRDDYLRTMYYILPLAPTFEEVAAEDRVRGSDHADGDEGGGSKPQDRRSVSVKTIKHGGGRSVAVQRYSAVPWEVVNICQSGYRRGALAWDGKVILADPSLLTELCHAHGPVPPCSLPLCPLS